MILEIYIAIGIIHFFALFGFMMLQPDWDDEWQTYAVSMIIAILFSAMWPSTMIAMFVARRLRS